MLPLKEVCIEIDVVRSQCYAQIRDGGSYQYFYSQTPPYVNTAYDVWFNLVKGPDEAKEKFFQFINTGKNPDYTNEIRWSKEWLAEHGHKGGDWANAIRQKKEGVAFMEGDWRGFVRLITPVKVRYNVITDRPYNGKSNYEKWMPNRPEDKFVHIEEGYIFKIN